MGSTQEDGHFDYFQFALEMAALSEEVKLGLKEPENASEVIDVSHVISLQNKMNRLFAEIVARLKDQELQLDDQKKQIQNLAEDRNLIHILTAQIEIGTLKFEVNQKIIERNLRLISQLS